MARLKPEPTYMITFLLIAPNYRGFAFEFTRRTEHYLYDKRSTAERTWNKAQHTHTQANIHTYLYIYTDSTDRIEACSLHTRIYSFMYALFASNIIYAMLLSLNNTTCDGFVHSSIERNWKSNNFQRAYTNTHTRSHNMYQVKLNVPNDTK